MIQGGRPRCPASFPRPLNKTPKPGHGQEFGVAQGEDARADVATQNYPRPQGLRGVGPEPPGGCHPSYQGPRSPMGPSTLPDARLLEEFTPRHVEIRSCPLSLGEEKEAVRADGP